MATKTTKGGCPKGQVSDGKGGCKTLLPAKPNTTTTAKATETAEEKAERIAKEKEAAAAAEQKRVANMSKKEFRQEKQGIKRNVKVADLKAGKEGKGGKIATTILTGLASAVGVAEGVKGLLKKEKNGGTIKTKMKTGGIMKTKMKKMGAGGMHMMPNSAMMKKGGAKKYLNGGTTGPGPVTGPSDEFMKATGTGKKITPTKTTTTTTTTKNNGAKSSKEPLKKANTGGGIPITQKAADRKVAKGKGAMTYKYGNMDAPGTGNNKGSYVKYGKDKESGLIGGVQFKSMKGKARPVRKMGGATKKK